MQNDLRENFLYVFFTNGSLGIYDLKTGTLLKQRQDLGQFNPYQPTCDLNDEGTLLTIYN